MDREQFNAMFQEELLRILGDYSAVPLEIENALVARGFAKVTETAPLLGTSTVYVASISGGAVNVPITFVNGNRTV